MTLLQKWQMFWNRKSLNRAIRHANHVKNTTGHKCFVLLSKNKGYRAVTKRAVKQLITQKAFPKEVTMKEVEKMSVYTTT